MICVYSSTKVHHVDHISEPTADNDKCKLLNVELATIGSGFSGGGTNTAAALKHAKVIFQVINSIGKICHRSSLSINKVFCRLFYQKLVGTVRKLSA